MEPIKRKQIENNNKKKLKAEAIQKCGCFFLELYSISIHSRFSSIGSSSSMAFRRENP